MFRETGSANATSKFRQPLPEYAGRHLWIVIGFWEVDNPARERVNMQLANLLTVEGPGCLHCGTPWTPELGAHCPGGAPSGPATGSSGV